MTDVHKTHVTDLKDLISHLHDALSGDEADVDHIIHLMESYTSNASDWRKYAHLDSFKYTRNLVDDGNGKFNLMILAWNCGQASSIHDHAGSHCCMKVLDGKVHETLYETPGHEGDHMVAKRESELGRDQVAYIHDKIGLHRVSNPDHARPAYTLHLYSPPFQSCHRFDEGTGKCHDTPKITFFSSGGKKIKHVDGDFSV